MVSNRQPGLKMDEEEYIALFETMSLGVVYQDKNGFIISANPAAEEILGLTLDQMQGRTSTDPRWRAVHEDMSDFPGETHPSMVALKTGEKVINTIMGVYNSKNESYTWININATPQFKKNESKPYQVYTTFEDITERKKAEKTYRNALDNMMEGCQIISHDWRYIYVNEAVARHGRHKKEDLLGYTMMEIYPGIEETEMFSKLKNTMETRQLQQMENYFKYPDGTGQWFELRVFPVHEGIFILSLDIDKRKRLEIELKESEQMFKNVANYTYDWEYWVDPEGNFIYVSPSSERITGYKPEEFIDDPGLLKRIIHPDDNKFLKHYEEDSTSEKDASVIRFRTITKKGEERWIAHGCQPVYSDKGKFIGRRASNRDITDGKKAEEALKKSEEQLRFLTDNMTDVIGQIDHEGNLTYFSPSLKYLTGFRPQELVGKPATGLVHHDDVEFVSKSIQKAIETKEIVTIEYRTLKQDGGFVWVEANGKAIFNGADSYKTIIFTVRNISDRKKAERELMESEEKYKNLFDKNPNYCILLSNDGLVLDTNLAAEQITGLNRYDIIGKHFTELNMFPQKDLEKFGIFYSYMGEEDELKPIEMRIFDKNNNIRLLEVIATNIKEEGEFRYILLICTDITERKQMEDEIHDNLLRLNLALEAADLGVYDLDMVHNTSIRTPNHDKIFGYDEPLPQWGFDELFEHIIPEDELEIQKIIENVAGKEKYHFQCRIRRSDNEIRWINVYGKVFYTEKDRAYRTLGVVSDITDIKTSEERLKSLLTEKEALLKEIHHRVKNNMQIVISLLNLQEEHVKSEETKTVLTDSQSRIMSMADIHENLYRSHDLSHIDFKEYIKKLISDIFSTYGVQTDKIKFMLVMEDNEQNMETAIPLGLIINELVTNSLKHAFPEKGKGTIIIEMKTKNKDEYELIIADDGIGMPEEIDIKESLGLQIVNTLVNQLNGQITQDISQGTKNIITFKELPYIKRI